MSSAAYTISNCYRYTSRAMLIPFKLPTVGPTNQQEAESFEQISRTMMGVSSAVGWAISIGRELRDGRQFDDDRLERVRLKLPGVEPRLCTAYTTLLFVVEKVCLYFCMVHKLVVNDKAFIYRYLRRQISYT